jgi:hypothetical protein
LKQLEGLLLYVPLDQAAKNHTPFMAASQTKGSYPIPRRVIEWMMLLSPIVSGACNQDRLCRRFAGRRDWDYPFASLTDDYSFGGSLLARQNEKTHHFDAQDFRS